jgi:uncharacterized membrane protein
MRNFKLAIVFISLILAGCSREGWTTSEREYSQLKSETAEVVQLSYVPSTTMSGSGMGYNISDGSFSIVGTTNTTQEVWAVVFKCHDHNKAFAINDKNVYDKAKVGQTVTLEYIDEMNVYYVMQNNQWVMTGQQIVDQHTKRIVFDDVTIERK